MAEQRPMFRFRLPWLSAVAAPRPSEPPVQVPPQPTITSAPQQPTFRPAGIAPSKPPPPAPRTEPQPPPKPEPQPLPARAADESRVASQPASPARATQTRAASVPPSPSQGPPPRTVSQPPSPPKKSEPVPQQTSKPPFRLIQPPSFVPREQEPKPIGSMKPSEEQPKTQIKSEIVSESQYQRDRVTTQAAQISDGVAAVAPTSMAVKEGKPEDGKKDAVHQVKEEQTKETLDEQMRKALTKLLTGASGLGTQTRELTTSAFQSGERKQEEESFDRKKPLPVSDSDEKQIKTVSSTHLKEKSTRDDIHQKVPLQKEIKDNILKFTHRLTSGNSKQAMDGKPPSIITLAGENKGAFTFLGSESAKTDGSVHIHCGYKIGSNEIRESTTDGEGSSQEQIPRDPIVGQDKKTKVYVNSNMQSTNNSLLFESSVTERNPGVQLDFSHNQGEHTKSTVQSESIETHKAEFSITPAENLTYQATIGSQSLGGLFIEPSDSDPDNPEKPQLEGCFYNSGEMSKDKEIVLH